MKADSQKKTQEVVKAENKKPPVSNTKGDTKEESKAILKDHIHGDKTQEVGKEIGQFEKTNQTILNKDNEILNDNTNSLLITEPITEGKELINIKPKEEYLKEKIVASNLNKNIIKGVNQGLELTIKNIETELKQNIIPFSDSSKELTESINVQNTKRFNLDNINKNNIIKELKAQENQLKSNIYLLTQNQKLLENEGYLNFSENPNNISVIDENIRRKQVKEIKQSKENLIQKLDEIAFHIKELMNEENKENKKLNIKAFLDNFERDKEIAEARARKYEQEAKSRRQKLVKDINQLAEKKRLELEAKEQEEEARKELKVKNQRIKEKELAEKRTKENNQKLLQIKVFINDKPKENTYIYKEKKKDFQKLEEKRIKTEANKRKEKMRHVTKEECDQFAIKFNENKVKTQIELAEKALQLNELWKERKDLLPKYTSPFYSIVENEIFKTKENEEIRQLQIETNAKIRKDFGEQIMETRKPSINPKLKQERIDRLIKKEKNKNKRINHTAELYSRPKSLETKDMKPRNRFKAVTKLVFGDGRDINTNINQKHNIGNSSSFVNKKRQIPDKPFDYLPEIRKKRELISERLKSNGQSPDYSAKWNKMLCDTNKRSLIENVETVKYKAEKLQQEAKQKEQFLKLNGGAEKFPEIGEQVSILLIDAIQAKLCILNSVAKSNK